MKLLFTLCLFFLSFLRISATHQQADILYIDGEKYYILNKISYINTVSEYIKNNDLNFEINSSLWRGYISEFQIKNNIYQIKDILIPVKFSEKNFIRLKDYDKTLFEPLEKVNTNTVLILSKENMTLYHLGDHLSSIKVIEIHNNKVVKDIEMNSCEDFTKFKNEQFQKYKLTEAYKKDYHNSLKTIQSSREKYDYKDEVLPIEEEVNNFIAQFLFENENFTDIL